MAALLAASSLGATNAVAQTASPLSPGLHFLSQGPVKAAAQSESDDTKQATVLIDEDFSGLTAGSEDQPDGKKLVNDLGDFENPSLLRPYSSELADRPWGGEGLYAAGGAIAIKDGWFLNTPAGNMAGEVTLTFRARLGAEASATEGAKALDLIFLSRKDLIDYERRHYDLTREWQTFTFTSDKGAFEATGFQFMANTETTILIDDIHVERVSKSIAAPEAFEPGDATEYGFTAEWTPTPTATEYLLSVYSKTAGEGEVKGCGDFSQVQADADGVIDAANPHYPRAGTSTGPTLPVRTSPRVDPTARGPSSCATRATTSTCRIATRASRRPRSGSSRRQTRRKCHTAATSSSMPTPTTVSTPLLGSTSPNWPKRICEQV